MSEKDKNELRIMVQQVLVRIDNALQECEEIKQQLKASQL
jgi:hypothetical protein